MSMIERIITRAASLRSEGKIHAKDDSWSLAWNRSSMYLTEAPITSPKNPLRALDPDRKGKAVLWTWHHELFPSYVIGYPFLENIFLEAKISTRDTAKMVRTKLEDSFERFMDFLRTKGAKSFVKSEKWVKEVQDWLDGVSPSYPDYIRWNKEFVAPAEFIPRTMKPIKAQGKDFEITVGPSSFSVYSRYESYGSGDDSYSGFSSKTPAAARKFYVMLQKNPDALKQTTMSQFSDFLSKNKIPYDYLSSSWR